MVETGIIRPRLDEDFVFQIKRKYPEETEKLNNEETLEWALKKFLEFEEFVTSDAEVLGSAKGV